MNLLAVFQVIRTDNIINFVLCRQENKLVDALKVRNVARMVNRMDKNAHNSQPMYCIKMAYCNCANWLKS